MDRKDSFTEVFLKSAGEPFDKNQITKIKPIWWFNKRSKNVGGLRITDECLSFVQNKSQIKIYEIELPNEILLSPQILIWLDQYIDSPWHLVKRKLTVISERVAFEIYLFSGDVKKFGLNKSLLKRKSQI